MSDTERTFKQIKSTYKGLRVGQAMYCRTPGCRSGRIVGVGNKYIHIAGGTKVTAKDIRDWWMG